MKKEIYKAAVRGDVKFLNEAKAKDVEAAAAVYDDDDLLGLTHHKNNIIHVAAEHGQLDFIKAALEFFPAAADRRKLICGTNSDQDTPLHMAAKQDTQTIAEYLISFYNQIPCLEEDDDERVAASMTKSPWRAQNKQGNTPLHVALMNGGKSIRVAAYLLGVDSEVASYSNKRKHTPLHLAVQYNNEGSKTSMTKVMNTLNGLGASTNYTKSHFEEDSFSLIELLLKSAPEVCCLPDEGGMTPLIRAALNSYLRAVEAIIDYCPESVEICDSKGRSILHHIKLPNFLDARKFLSIPEICALMDRQDEDGYTPLHIAIMNNDSNMVKAMIERNANFAIKNIEGTSPAALIHSESSSFLDKVKVDFMKGCTNLDDLMTKSFYEAVGYSKWELLRRTLKVADKEKSFLTRLPDGNNVVHVAVENCPDDWLGEFCYNSNEEESSQEMFILEALNKFPILACQTNFYGETPIHLTTSKRMFKPDGMPFTLLKQHLQHIKNQIRCYPLPPWEAKDTDGNSLLHLALKWNRFEFAKFIVEELDAKLVAEINNSKETPLHMLCRYGSRKTKVEKRDDDMVDLLIKKDISTVYLCDADGFTPLLRAVQSHRLKIAARILHHCPQSIKQYDSQFGRGIFHFISFNRKDDMIQDFCEIPQKKHLMTCCDHNFNTPLHLAIEQRRFGTIKILMEHLNDTINYRALNANGKTVINVLASLQNTPRWFQEFLSSKWIDLPGVVGTGRSIYGIHHSDLKEYMGTLGLVAALLTTITFTAAFTVPGGYNSNNGTPILSKRVAFRVFMFANVVGLCSSVMVLSCLIWFLNSGQVENEGSTLVDLSIGLLQLAFSTTLIAFMSGVYATTIDDIHHLAIFTCVLCSVVFLLMRKRLILDFLVPLFCVVYFFLHLCTICLTACSKWVARSLASRIKGIIRCNGGQQPSAS